MWNGYPVGQERHDIRGFEQQVGRPLMRVRLPVRPEDRVLSFVEFFHAAWTLLGGRPLSSLYAL